MANESMQPTGQSAAANAVAPRTFVCATRVIHGEGNDLPTQYEPGDPIVLSDESAIAALRKTGAIKLPEELMKADELAARQAALADENMRLLAELEALRAAQASQAAAASKSASKGAKASDGAPQ